MPKLKKKTAKPLPEIKTGDEYSNSTDTRLVLSLTGDNVRFEVTKAPDNARGGFRDVGMKYTVSLYAFQMWVAKAAA